MPGISGSIEGINSGFNTTEIVEAMLTYDKQRVKLLEYDQTVKTNQITTYQAINTKLLAFQTQAALLARRDTYNATKVSVSNEDYLTAIAGKDVALGNYSIGVTALAQNHQIASQGFSDQEAADLGTGTITIKVGDGSEKTITIGSDNSSLENIRDAINSAKAGVSASIINDGTSSNQYRLMLTAEETGAKNQISVSSSLSGGKQLDFTTSQFDAVEKSFSAAASSNPALGTTASYTGSENKTYTFTVAGNGTQTVGSGDITVNWTDGTNSGSILVSSADTEVELTGAGSDGLKLQFSAGDLVAGNTFTVQTFSPLLQKAQDAKVTLGSTDGGGSPITVSSATNLVDDLIQGVTLNLKKVSNGEKVNINVERDIEGIEQNINDFITKFNEVIGAIDDQFKFDPDNPDDAGILFGDRTLITLQNSLRGSVTARIDGLDSEFRMLASIGIRMGSSGKLAVVNRTELQEALRDNIDDVQRLLSASGTSTNSKISFVTMTSDTETSDEGYEVNITQAARKGYLKGANIADPANSPIVIDSTKKNIALRVDGILSDTITLTEQTYDTWEELAQELQQKINSDAKIGKLGVEVTYVDNGTDGYLTLTSGSFGNTSKVEVQASTSDNAHSILGLSTGSVFQGLNVEGTINGESATGVGQVLTGDDDNDTTAGLKLLVEMEAADLGNGAESTVSVFRGIASRAQEFANNVTKSIDGTLARRTSALDAQIDDIKERVTDMNERMELKRQRLLERFLKMEEVLGQLNSESAYLTAQLNQLAANFQQIMDNGRN